MKGAEFERRVRKIARLRQAACHFVADREKEAMGVCISAKTSRL